MWRQQSLFLRQALIVYDVLVSAGAFLATISLRDALARMAAQVDWVADFANWVGGVPPTVDVEKYQLVMLGLLPLWGLTFYYSGTSDFRRTYSALSVRFARAVLLGLALFVVAAFLFKLTFIARTYVAMFGVVQFVALMLGRVFLMEIIKIVRRRGVDGHRVVIVGANERGVNFASSLQGQSPWNIKLVGYVSVPGEEGHPEARPLLGYVGSLADLLDRSPVDEVVFAGTSPRPEVLKDAVAACDERGVDVLLSLPSTVPTAGTMQIANVSGYDYPLLNLRRTPTSEARLAIKRGMDLAGALTLLFFAWPVMLVTAVAIRMESKGPVLFKQVRSGRSGRKFTMLKFRSMVTDAEQIKEKLAHMNEMDGPVFKIKRDPRITKVGRFIRKTSIDELPQLFNIIAGDMSMVGPRPPLPSEVEQYEPWQRRRLSVKPGLTGLWQVSGRNQVDFDEWMQLDLAYIDNWSLWLDVKILFRTVPAVLLHRGAS